MTARTLATGVPPPHRCTPPQRACCSATQDCTNFVSDSPCLEQAPRLLCTQFSAWNGLHAARRQAPTPRAAAAVAFVPPSPAVPNCCLQWFTRVASYLPDPNPCRVEPRSGREANSGEAPPRGLLLRRAAPPPRAPFARGRPIWKQRPILERGPIRSDPPDRDLTAQNRRYRFGRSFCIRVPHLP